MKRMLVVKHLASDRDLSLRLPRVLRPGGDPVGFLRSPQEGVEAIPRPIRVLEQREAVWVGCP